MAKKSRTSIGLGIVGICFFSVCLFCLVSLFFFLPNSLSVYACGLITPVQRGNSSEEHFFNSDFTIILFSIYFSFFFF